MDPDEEYMQAQGVPALLNFVIASVLRERPSNPFPFIVSLLNERRMKLSPLELVHFLRTADPSVLERDILVNTLCASAPEEFNPEHPLWQEVVFRGADALLCSALGSCTWGSDGSSPSAAVEAMYTQSLECFDTFPAIVHLIIRLCVAKAHLHSEPPFHLSIIIPLRGDHCRILRYKSTAAAMASSPYTSESDQPDPNSVNAGDYSYRSRSDSGESSRTGREVAGARDALAARLREIAWLMSAAHEKTSWSVYLVDDLCPSNSGGVAVQVLDELRRALGDVPTAPAGAIRVPEASLLKDALSHVRVLFLRDAFAEKLAFVAKTAVPAHGGAAGEAVMYGMYEALRAAPRGGSAVRGAVKGDRHVVCTAALDLSVHLGQLGSIISSLLSGLHEAEIASRYAPESVARSPGPRDVRDGNGSVPMTRCAAPWEQLFAYVLRRVAGSVLPRLNDLTCPLRAFKAGVLAEVLPAVVGRRRLVEVEIVIRAELKGRTASSGLDDADDLFPLSKTAPDRVVHRAVPVGVVYCRCGTLEEVHRQNIPYMLNELFDLYTKLLPQNDEADTFVSLLSGLSGKEWQTLLSRIPPSIANCDPSVFDDWNAVTAAQLHQLAKA